MDEPNGPPDVHHVEGAQRSDHGHGQRDETDLAQLRQHDVPEHWPAAGTIDPPSANKILAQIVETREEQHQAEGDLRPAGDCRSSLEDALSRHFQPLQNLIAPFRNEVRGNASTSRALNRRLILNLLRNRGPISRAEMAQITGLSPAAVTFVVADLMEEALVVERETVSGTAGGRRPVPVDINYEAHLALGFKLNRSNIDCVLTDLATTPLAALVADVADTSPEGMTQTIAATIPRLIAQAGRQEKEIRGIGVSIPGEIDPSTGICLQSPRFGWKNLPFAELLATGVHVPAWIDDDVNAFAVAQRLFGVGRDHRNFAALAIGAGIGCSLVIKGEIYHGSHSAAGKLGHITSVPNGRLCECGRHGCLMAHASESYMLGEWQRQTGTEISRGLRRRGCRERSNGTVHPRGQRIENRPASGRCGQPVRSGNHRPWRSSLSSPNRNWCRTGSRVPGRAAPQRLPPKAFSTSNANPVAEFANWKMILHSMMLDSAASVLTP